MKYRDCWYNAAHRCCADLQYGVGQGLKQIYGLSPNDFTKTLGKHCAPGHTRGLRCVICDILCVSKVWSDRRKMSKVSRISLCIVPHQGVAPIFHVGRVVCYTITAAVPVWQHQTNTDSTFASGKILYSGTSLLISPVKPNCPFQSAKLTLAQHQWRVNFLMGKWTGNCHRLPFQYAACPWPTLKSIVILAMHGANCVARGDCADCKILFMLALNVSVKLMWRKIL